MPTVSIPLPPPRHARNKHPTSNSHRSTRSLIPDPQNTSENIHPTQLDPTRRCEDPDTRERGGGDFIILRYQPFEIHYHSVLWRGKARQGISFATNFGFIWPSARGLWAIWLACLLICLFVRDWVIGLMILV